MFFSQDRTQMREFFRQCLEKARAGTPMEALEAMIADIVGEHPEYHRYLEPDRVEQEYTGADGLSNPFLHMGMHIALREQRGMGQPPELGLAYERLVRLYGEPHHAEHALMECLGEVLWEAQRQGTEPDQERYRQCLDRLGR